MIPAHRDFFIIQYLKDIFRQEGRNIGVMLVLDGKAQFHALGQVDQKTTDPGPFLQMNRLPPSLGWFYQEWVNWFHEVATHGYHEPQYLQRLLNKLDEEGYPFIAKGGGVITVAPKEPPEKTLQALMRQLIDKPGKRNSEFMSRLGALIATLTLHQEPGFFEDVEVEFLPSGEPPVTVRVSYLIDPPSGSPRTIFKIVRTKTSTEAFLRQINDAALTFRLMEEHGFASKNRCIVLTEEATTEKQDRLKYLSTLAHLVAVTDPDAATIIRKIIYTDATF